ncbi:hypothetical protein F4604DRAFT_1729108 [Suillus subluteus]|nr:hypothetical protein F4604DRAFT_1729108 [Suillus subluteus]
MSPSIDPVARNIAIITTILTALMVLEYIYSFKDETRLVWPRFRKTIEAKIFIMTRYAGLAGQSFNIWFAFRLASGVPNSPFACKIWTSYQIATIQCLLLSVESLLMLRVYKMYNKGKYISAVLFILGSAQSSAMAVNARWIITETRYSPTCVPHYHSRIYVGVSIITTFVFIVVAMLWRFIKSPSGWSEVSRAWLKLAVRDGGCTAIAITVILIFMFLCTTGVIDTQMSGNIVFYVLLSCLWFAAGRIVLHQEKFRIIQESQKGGISDPSRWTEMIEVNLDDISPFDDPDVCPTSPSGSEVESTKVSTLSTLSAAGMKDIADEHL